MNYDYLKRENAPQILVQARALIGTKEIIGTKSNDVIMSWAKDLGIENTYTNDDIAWCGLFMAIVCKRANLEINMTAREALWALNWNKFGTRQTVAMLGDILTFRRQSGGHVGIYVGEDDLCYHVLGGPVLFNRFVLYGRLLRPRVSFFIILYVLVFLLPLSTL